MLEALQSASDSLGSDNVKIKMADASNPGIPPSSLMAFLRKVGNKSHILSVRCLATLNSLNLIFSIDNLI